MPSDIAKQIVDQIFSDDKAQAIDSINDALAAASFDAIQQQKIEFAKQMGFDLGDTGQEDADAIADALPDEYEEPQTTVAEYPEEETTDEDDETNR